MRSIHRSGTKAIRAKPPQWGRRKPMDSSTALRMVRIMNRDRYFFIPYVNQPKFTIFFVTLNVFVVPMIVDLFKAFVVGLAASAPVGPIAILVIQITLCKGFKAGFVTSLGSTVVDTVFAVIAIFALAYVQNFIEGNSIPIFIVGGLIVIALGLSMALSNPFRKMKQEEKAKTRDLDPSVKDFLSACFMGFTNPGAIAVMLALMAFFGIGESAPHDWSIFPVILGIAAGSASYWLAVTAVLDKFRKQFNMRTLIWINRITGAIVIVIGLATLAEGVMRIFV